MMIDALELLSDSQAITADAISTYVKNVLPTAGGAIGAGATGGPTANTFSAFATGSPVYLYARVDSALTSSGNTTSLIVSLESDDNTSLTTATVHLTLPEVEEAALVTGYWIAHGYPLPPDHYQKYVCVRYNVGAEENFTAGTVSAWLSETPPNVDRQYQTATLTGVN